MKTQEISHRLYSKRERKRDRERERERQRETERERENDDWKVQDEEDLLSKLK
jgi:hypothetical protein